MTEFVPTKYEISALMMLNGDLPMSAGGSWLNAAIEFLQESGYVTRSWNNPQLTEKGRKFLDDYRQGLGTTHI